MRCVANCLILLLFLWGCANSEEVQSRELAINYFDGIEDLPVKYLMNKNYMEDAGVTLELHKVTSGYDAIDLLLNGKLDYVIASPFVFVKQVMEGADIRYIGSFLETVTPYKLMFLKNSGITSIEDVKGKRFGIARNTQYEFFTEYFLTYNNIDLNSVDFVDIHFEDALNHLREGTIDITISTVPILNFAMHELKDNIGTMDINLQFNAALGIIVKVDYDVQSAVQFLELFKKAIYDLNYDLENNHPRASNILGYNMDIIKETQNIFNFGLDMNDLLLLNAKSEARWLLLKEEYSDTEMPDMSIYFDKRPLDALKSR